MSKRVRFKSVKTLNFHLVKVTCQTTSTIQLANLSSCLRTQKVRKLLVELRPLASKTLPEEEELLTCRQMN